MANRAQRRKEARAAQAAMNLPRAQREAEEARAKERWIQQFIADMEKNGPMGGYAGMRADAEANFGRHMETREMVVGALERNGITLQDLEKEYERGHEEGFRQAGMNIIQCCYAGICIALHDTFGFGEKRCYRALKACDEKIIWALNHSEMAEELLKKTGLTIDFDDPFERVQKIDD